MRFILPAIVLALSPALALAQKDAAVKSAGGHAAAHWPTALKIWEAAEPGYQEKTSARLLADAAEKAGFAVRRGVAGIPTTFVVDRAGRRLSDPRIAVDGVRALRSLRRCSSVLSEWSAAS